MSITDNANKNNVQHHAHLSFKDISHLFAQLDSQTVEQFYQGYQLWTEQQRIEQLKLQIVALQQEIAENATRMQQTEPPPVALAALAQLQTYGVEDIDLLDRMLERGEPWLDHAMELLEHCQRLDVIHGNYTEWCEHALEGAYEWIASMSDFSPLSTDAETTEPTDTITDEESTPEPLAEATEEQLLQKLMSDTDALPAYHPAEESTTSPIATSQVTETDDIRDETTTQDSPRKAITRPLPPLTTETDDERDEATTQDNPHQPTITRPQPSLTEEAAADTAPAPIEQSTDIAAPQTNEQAATAPIATGETTEPAIDQTSDAEQVEPITVEATIPAIEQEDNPEASTSIATEQQVEPPVEQSPLGIPAEEQTEALVEQSPSDVPPAEVTVPMATDEEATTPSSLGIPAEETVLVVDEETAEQSPPELPAVITTNEEAVEPLLQESPVQDTVPAMTAEAPGQSPLELPAEDTTDVAAEETVEVAPGRDEQEAIAELAHHEDEQEPVEEEASAPVPIASADVLANKQMEQVSDGELEQYEEVPIAQGASTEQIPEALEQSGMQKPERVTAVKRPGFLRRSLAKIWRL